MKAWKRWLRIRRSDYLGLIVFDCDGVITDHYSSWALLHEFFGSKDNKYFADLYKRDLISYLDWMKIDIALMIHSYGKPIHREDVVKALSQVKVLPEAKRIFEILKNMGFTVGIVSSGVDILVKRVCEDLGSDFCLYNELLFVDNELIPGGKPYVPLKEKPRVIRQLAEQYGLTMDLVTYIGDSVWDIPVFKEVGLSIAVEPCGEACCAAKYSIGNLLDAVDIVENYYRKKLATP